MPPRAVVHQFDYINLLHTPRAQLGDRVLDEGFGVGQWKIEPFASHIA